MNMLLKPLFTLILLAISLPSAAARESIGILVFDGVLTSDVTAPTEVFGAATKKSWFSNYEVMLVSVNKDKHVVTEEGLNLVADKTIEDDMDLSVLLVPSAYDMKPLLNNTDLMAFIQKQAKRVKWLASNCSGSMLLAEAGALKGKKATTWAGGESDFLKDYPDVRVQFDQNVVVDDGVITSNGSVVSYQAALTLLTQLSDADLAQEVADSIQWQRLQGARYTFASQ